jgi:hypothetical protein
LQPIDYFAILLQVDDFNGSRGRGWAVLKGKLRSKTGKIPRSVRKVRKKYLTRAIHTTSVNDRLAISYYLRALTHDFPAN